MAQDCSINISLSEDRDFWFNFDGNWEKIGTWIYECWDVDIVSDKVSKMTFDRIKKHFSDLGYPNPKAICVRDPDKNFEEGLYLIEDEESCRKSLQYIEVLNVEKVKFFIDDDNMPLPDDITPSILLVPTISSDGNSIQSERVQELVDVRVMEYAFNCAIIPTQCSQPNRQESEYVNPMGYISEEEDDDDGGEFVSEDNGTEIEDATNTDDDIENLANDNGYFMLGMTFANVKEAREAIHEYGVKFGYKLKFVKNDTTRVRVHCGKELNCPFKLFISKDGEEGGFVVKTATLEHCCFRQSEVPSASQHYIAKIFKDTIYKNPKFRAKDMQLEIKKHLKQQVSEYKCKRAKKHILHELQGSFKQEFANLGAYAEILKKK